MGIKYTIEISYKTGDSFHSEECVSKIEYTWENLERVQESLKRIENHYQFDIKYHSMWSKPEEALPEGVKWSQKYRMIMLELVDDNGDPFLYSPFWVGYFETLYEAKIIIDEESLGSYRPHY